MLERNRRKYDELTKLDKVFIKDISNDELVVHHEALDTDSSSDDEIQPSELIQPRPSA